MSQPTAPHGHLMPSLMLLGIIGGVTFVVGSSPIEGRGDYGQWLMTSRYYLGQDVPDYRTISALPPLIPLLLAVVQVVIPNPVTALQAFSIIVLLGLGLSFYLSATALFVSRMGGVFAAALGLLVTDRFLELFAFGGLPQAGATTFLLLSVAAFVRAGRGPSLEPVWWILGSASLAFASLSHVGTGMIAVPVGLCVAFLSVLRIRRVSWRKLLQGLLPLALILVGILVYWFVVLVPASREYVSNPASLAYRGPNRLLVGLFSYWPTAIVIALGAGAVGLGTLGEVLRRSVSRYVVLLVWGAAAWGALLVSAVTQASTDYPRFAPSLLAPLVLAAAGALLWLFGSLAAYLNELMPRIRPADWVFATATVLIVTVAPFAAQRHANQAREYEPLDAQALTPVVDWVDDELPDGQAVLAPVREGKWIEGVTGREALFSLPVRYAFRPAEWQRSVDADALLRTSSALTNGFFFAKFVDSASNGTTDVPRSLLVGVNHGGEYVDILRILPIDSQVLDGSEAENVVATLADLNPINVTRTLTAEEASIRTAWTGEVPGADISFAQTIHLQKNSANLDLIDEAVAATGAGGLQMELRPPDNISITTVNVSGRQADVYFTRTGAKEPAVRITVAQETAVIELIEGGGLRVRSLDSTRLDLQVTALTASNPSPGLDVLYPPQLVDEYNVGAVVLIESDPSFEARRRRMEVLGFRAALVSGPYEIMARN